jgi:hypothetical protein
MFAIPERFTNECLPALNGSYMLPTSSKQPLKALVGLSFRMEGNIGEKDEWRPYIITSLPVCQATRQLNSFHESQHKLDNDLWCVN